MSSLFENFELWIKFIGLGIDLKLVVSFFECFFLPIKFINWTALKSAKPSSLQNQNFAVF